MSLFSVEQRNRTLPQVDIIHLILELGLALNFRCYLANDLFRLLKVFGRGRRIVSANSYHRFCR